MSVGAMFSAESFVAAVDTLERNLEHPLARSSHPSCLLWLNSWYAQSSSAHLRCTDLFQGDIFPQLQKKQNEIKEILDEEEESFSRTLDRGEKLFDQYAMRAREARSSELSGADVWRLYDTFGFPVDLTRLMAEELSLSINEKELEAAQERSKEASKGTFKRGKADCVKLDVHDLAALEKNDAIPKTDDSPKYREYHPFVRCQLKCLTVHDRAWKYNRKSKGHLLRSRVSWIYC